MVGGSMQRPIPKKFLGQHWLADPRSLAYIAQEGSIDDKDIVLEVGPGPGDLTHVLSTKAGKVIAVELDTFLVESLLQRFSGLNVEVHNNDILKFDLTQLPKGYKVVANIPYYLTSKLIRVLSESSNPPYLIVLLVQKEVAERLAAKPGQLSILGVTAQYFWNVKLGKLVTRDKFVPPPKVDSQVVILSRRSTPLFKVNQKKFFQLVRAGFSSRRKTLTNSLSGSLRIEKGALSDVFNETKISPSLRAQNLTLEEWNKLYSSLTKASLL